MGTIGKNHIYMTNNRLNKNFLPLYVAKKQKGTSAHGYTKHSGNITTTLLRIMCKGYLVVYICLKETNNPKWKLFGCRMEGTGH